MPNLFDSLFDFHPREGHTPRENFLTESFAYLLQTDDRVLKTWLSIVLGRDINKVTCKIATRPTEKDLIADRSFYPDLLIEGIHSKGEPIMVFCEHKWDSVFNQDQLRCYRRLAEGRGNHAVLVFLGATHTQLSQAKKCFSDGFCKCFLWEDVFEALNRITNQSTLLTEFLEFMKSHGLSPAKPLSVETMRGFLQATDFLKSLSNIANRLNDKANYSWDVIPKRFHALRYVHDAWGRVGIRFETKDWRPALTVGFLYDEKDHKVTFIDESRGIDLLLRIEAEPQETTFIEPVVAILQAKRKALRKTAASVLLKGEPGNGNPYSVLIVRECLADVINGKSSAQEQLEVIHKRLITWLGVIFDDCKLEKAFKKCRLDSGMK